MRAGLPSNLPHARTVPAASTADAVREVAADATGPRAAIGTRLAAAALRGGDAAPRTSRTTPATPPASPGSPGPTTAPPPPAGGPAKTALVFWGAGSGSPGLAGVAAWPCSRSRGVNLTRIESRPLRRGMGEYMFFLDLEGSTRRRARSPGRSSAAHARRGGSSPRLVSGDLRSVRAVPLHSASSGKRCTPRHHWGPCRSSITRGTDLNADGSSSRWSGGRVLVLNATYEPINVCTVRRATVLLLKDKAEVVEIGASDLHWATGSLPRRW